MDPTGHDALARWLAYGHPALMLVALGMAAVGLRAGLAMRKRRRRGEPPKASLLASHLRMARPAVLLLLLGFAGGPLSALILRDWSPFETLHAWLGVLAAALFVATGWLGLRMQQGKLPRAKGGNPHGLLGTIAMLVGAVAAAAGMVLLP